MSSSTSPVLAISSSPGLMVIKTDKAAQNSGCICTNKKCRLLSRCFQSINDIRGRYFAVPTLDGKYKTEVKEFKIERTLVHLGLPRNDKELVCSHDIRDRSTFVTPSKRTRSNTKKVKVKRKHIAHHHFHPELLQEVVVNQGFTTIDYIDAALIKDLGLLDNGYSEEDRFKGKDTGVMTRVFVPVPSYKKAERDYVLASSRYRLNQLISSCRSKQRGESFLASRREAKEAVIKPVEK